MARLLALAAAAALLAPPATAHAGACGGYSAVRAAGPTLARRGLVLVEGELAHVDALKRARFVTARGDATPARIVRVETQGTTQVLLAPTAALPANTQVHLEVGIPELDEQLAEHPLTTNALEHSPAPRWLRAPKTLKRRAIPSNKGDSVDIIPVDVALEAPAFVIAHIEPLKSSRPPPRSLPSTAPAVAIYHPATPIYPPAKRVQIEIGNTGCHSMLRLIGRFTATLAALDDDGAETAAPGAALAIDLK